MGNLEVSEKACSRFKCHVGQVSSELLTSSCFSCVSKTSGISTRYPIVKEVVLYLRQIADQ